MEVNHEDRASVEESRELLAEHIHALVESASQSGSHLECIIGAGTALGAMVSLLSAAMEVGTSSIARFAFLRRSSPSYLDLPVGIIFKKKPLSPHATFTFSTHPPPPRPLLFLHASFPGYDLEAHARLVAAASSTRSDYCKLTGFVCFFVSPTPPLLHAFGQ